MAPDRFGGGQCLRAATQKLTRAGIGTARLDALVLLEDVTDRDRAWLLAHPEHALSSAQAARLENLLNRRAGHEPLAYIRGRTEFYGREFVLNHHVLEPRPESETMIDLLKALPMFNRTTPTSTKKRTITTPQTGKKSPVLRLADIGAGSGALGITAKLELPDTQVDLLEIDPKAAKVAKTNVDKFTLSITVIRSDLLAQSGKGYDVLLCNLPYVPDDFHLNPAAMREPRLAIFGGPDGLDVYRRLFQQVEALPRRPLYILIESLPPQHGELRALAGRAGYALERSEDFIQVFTRPA